MFGGATQFQASLLQQATEGARADRIAAQAVAAWRGISSALSPIIGHGGVSALFERSLHLATPRHPTLVAALDSAASADDFAALRATLSSVPGPEAAAAQGELLEAFYGLLAGLIGEPLTTRLLQPVWDTLQSGDPAKDDAP